MSSGTRFLLATVLTTAALAARAAGVTEVSFVEPGRYTDAGRTAAQIEYTTRTLGEHLKRLGQALPDGQTLRVEVLDVDLAGIVRSGPRGDVRVLRVGADWPRIQLRYTLSAGGQTLQSGEESLFDMNYFGTLQHSASDGPLPYEQRLLTEWFNSHFGPAAQAQ